MPSIRRRAAIAVAGLATAGALVAPLAAQADTVRYRVAGSSTNLTYSDQVGFATMKFSNEVLPDQQRWERLNAPGPGVYIRNVVNRQCLRAHPIANAVVRTVTCDFSGTSAASMQQQWIHNINGQLANRDRLARNVAANSLSVDFGNINRVVRMEPFTGGSNQKWSRIFD